MSLSWRERVFVALEPGAVHAVRRGEKRRAEHEWSQALEQALDGWPGGEVTIVVSNRFVRYAVVPPAAGVSDGEEALALARHHFLRVHGERARDWHVRFSAAGRLASAVDLALLEGLKAFFARARRFRLASVQPYLMSAFNCVRARVPREGAWLVLPERHAVCVGLFESGAWAGVSVSRACTAAQAVLERERTRMGTTSSPRKVLTGDADPFAMALSAR